MIEATGNLWTYPADVRVITTNGTIKKDGSAVMGRGCAYEATQKYPDIAATLGRSLTATGNRVYPLLDHPEKIVSFPVKHHWMQKADLDLIRKSALDLVSTINILFPDAKVIVMPRPGCGNGKLDWKDVQPVLAGILDERFHVITF